ncbi:MAG: hypothetical protein WC635_14200 [Bacteriovorax sp.]|jgi:hypothetical protein
MQKKLWITCSLIGLSSFGSGCSVFKDRRPASDQDTILSQIYNEVYDANKLVSTDSQSCKNSYDVLYKKLFNIAGVDSYFDNANLSVIDEDIHASFLARISVKDAFKAFTNNNAEDAACLSSAQDVFKALRYVEDYLVEARMEKASAAGPTEYVSMKGDFPYFLINPKFADDFKSYEDLKSGDVILSRGNAYSSAAIARIAQSDYQFSHLSFVYRDADSKELYTSEAHIEIGSVTAPFEDHVNEKNARSVIFRYNNSDIAHRASKAMYERVKKHQESGKNIEYDFSMNYKDDSKLFCSEIISNGFKLAEPESDFVPKFKSKFTKGIIPFLNTIGVQVNSENVASVDVFAPGDVQFDPNFEMVAEWRNPKKLEEQRYKDFILTKMFEMMDKDGYKIDPTIKMDAMSRTFWMLRRAPIVKKFLEKKFSLNMNPAQMELFMALDKIGEAFYKNIEMRSIEFDHQMTPKEIYAAIDEFVKKDFEKYKKYKKTQNSEKPLFHILFHP